MTKQQIKTGVGSSLATIVASMLLFAPMASAATVNWSGHNEEGDNTTSASGNWYDSVPINGDSAVFGVDGNYQTIDNNLSNLSLAKIIFSGEVGSDSSKSYSISGNGLTVTEAIEAAMTGTGGDHKVGVDVTLGDNVTFMTDGVDTLEVGGDETVLDLGSNNLTLQPDGGTITLTGEIDGSGDVVVNGEGKVSMLAAPADGYSGSTQVTTGEYVVTSSTQGNIVVDGGILKGSSDLLGTVTMSSGSIEPGMSPGCLGTSDLTLTGGTYTVELDGTDQCSEFDQVTVVGAVDLGSATELDIQLGYEPEEGDAFAIILNDDDDAVEGTFADLEDGAEFTVDGYTFQINYNAGDGENDVVLLVVETPDAPDTGVGTLLTNPLVTLMAAFGALGVIGGLKYADQKRK